MSRHTYSLSLSLIFSPCTPLHIYIYKYDIWTCLFIHLFIHVETLFMCVRICKYTYRTVHVCVYIYICVCVYMPCRRNLAKMSSSSSKTSTACWGLDWLLILIAGADSLVV